MYTPPIDVDKEVLGAHVSTKGSNAEIFVHTSAEELDGMTNVVHLAIYAKKLEGYKRVL